MSLDGLRNRADLTRFVQQVIRKPENRNDIRTLKSKVHQNELDIAALVAGAVPDATTLVKGKVQLAGDLAGTAAAPTVPGLAGKAPTVHTHAQSDVTGLVAALAAKEATANKNVAGGYAGLDGSGKIITSALPAIAISKTTVVASQAAQLAVTAEEGDVVVRSDEHKTYIQNGGATGTMADWTWLDTPTDAVLSVAGKTGVVTLVTSDISGLVAALAAKADLASPALTGNPTSPTASFGDADTTIANTQFVQTASDFARLGVSIKPAVYAASIAALPAHGALVGDVLTATNNGLLAPSFGSRKFTWASGSYGSGNGQFNTPYDCAVDSSGNIFVCDYLNSRIQKFNSSGVYQSQFSTATGPTGLAIDGSSNIWVVAQNGISIYKYNSSGTLLATYSTNSSATTLGGISIDSSGNVFVSATRFVFPQAYEIQKFNSSGVYQSTIGSSGSGNGQFNSPSSLVHDGSNNLFVVDSGNNRVQKFNTSGTYQSQFGSGGSGDGQFAIPSGIAIDSTGNLWVSDYFNNRVQQFNSSGTFVSKTGNQGVGNGQYQGPRGIAFSSTDDLYVADSVNNRFQKLGVFSLSAGVQGGVMVRHEGGGLHVDNGIYDVTNPGSGATKWVLTRRPDAASSPSGLLKSGTLVVAQTTNGAEGLCYLLTTPDPISVNSSAMQWDRFQPGGPPTEHSTSHAPGGSDQIDELPFGLLGVHTLNTPFTTTGTHTTMQDEGLTKSISYQANRELKVTLKVNPNASGGGNVVRYRVLRGATQVAQWQRLQPASGVDYSTFVAYINGPASAGTDTFKVQIAAASVNTAVQSYGDADFSRQLIIEDVGPVV